ncbi:type IV secretory system conjugative DNA transfer family protein [Streptomyces sp. NPDC018584]|uniref:type IV secretory system conjugative DNA transfer family protein n=1 Tax=unclassified Streptomyces TaxID=2593676 RepID=UPI0037A47425
MRNNPAALHTANSHPLADGAGESPVTTWLVSRLPDSTQALGAWALGTGLVVAVLCGVGYRRLADRGKKEKPGLDGAADALGEGFLAALGGAGKFLAGKPMWGEPGSDASFWKSGAAHSSKTANGLGAAAAIEAKPQQRARSKGLTAWHQCPGAVRSVVRLSAVAAAAGLCLAPLWTCAFLAVLTPVALTLVKAAGGNPRHRTDAGTYGPGLWAALVQVLRLSAEDQALGKKHWIALPDDVGAADACVLVRLPLQWIGSEKERAMLAYAIHTRLPGEWAASYTQRGPTPYAQFTPKPAPKPRPQLAPSVPWKSTGNPYRVFVGQAIEGDQIMDVVVSTESDTPHWGVAGDTGSGKSTMLYIPVVHGRVNGWVVDILDNKENSMRRAEGHSGVRIHKTTRACMGAFAEFMTSMIAAEKALGRDGDPQLRAMLVPRLLVIDELPTLIRLAYTWWKHGIKQKGAPPFIDWLTIILMMGRSSDHRVVVGSQQFDNALFGGTIGRKQIGTKIVIGKQDMVSWGVAFGQNAPRFGYDSTVKGRGAYADNKSDPDGGDYAWVREFQAAYITPHVQELLAETPQAPAWFDHGQMAPWITPEALAQAQEEAAAADFLPGGKFAPLSPPVVPVRGTTESQRGLAGAQAGTTALKTLSGTRRAVSLAAEQAEDAALPATFSIADACERGILPWGYETARKYLLQRSKGKGIPVPEGVSDGKVTYYTEAELRDWLRAWHAAKLAA